MYPNALALAKRLKKPLVVFDIEHTGGTKENRAITELAAQVIHPDGTHVHYASLVKPPVGTYFMPIVSSITGITQKTVESAPAWSRVMHDFVLPHKNAVWVGFNSRVCDTPIILGECRKHGVDLECLPWQLDLMRVGSTRGKLSERVAQMLPNFDTGGAHRAAKDVLMTLALLEVMIPTMTDEPLQNQGLIPRPKKPREVRTAPLSDLPEAQPGEAMDFLVEPGTSRRGQSWSPAEMRWVTDGFQAGTAIGDLAAAVGRSTVAIDFVLLKFGLVERTLDAAPGM